MEEQEIQALLERQIKGTFWKAGLLRIPKININLEKPDKKGWIKTSDGRSSIANVGGSNGNEILKLVNYYPNGEVWFVERIPKEPIIFTFPIGKNEYCYTHIARHEAVHYIRIILETKEEFETHDKRFYEIGNLLFPDFEYNDKHLCQNCPAKSYKVRNNGKV